MSQFVDIWVKIRQKLRKTSCCQAGPAEWGLKFIVAKYSSEPLNNAEIFPNFQFDGYDNLQRPFYGSYFTFIFGQGLRLATHINMAYCKPIGRQTFYSCKIIAELKVHHMNEKNVTSFSQKKFCTSRWTQFT